MQGNCTRPVPSAETLGIDTSSTSHAPLLPLLPGQCVMVVDSVMVADSPVFDVGEKGRLWLQGVYIRLKKNPDVDSVSELISVTGEGAGLWMKGVTLQVCALLVVVVPSSVLLDVPLLRKSCCNSETLFGHTNTVSITPIGRPLRHLHRAGHIKGRALQGYDGYNSFGRTCERCAVSASTYGRVFAEGA